MPAASLRRSTLERDIAYDARVRLFVLVAVLAAPAVAVADSEDAWPVLHDVLARQRELPCQETWQYGPNDVRTYTMRFNQKGQLLQRTEANDTKRYRYGGGRIVGIQGTAAVLGSKSVTTISYGNRGIASLKVRTTTTHDILLRKPTTTTTVFELIWKYDGTDTVRISPVIDGRAEAPDVLHLEAGRLVSTDLSVGDVLTAAYDAQGRMMTVTTSYNGKASDVVRYSYDGNGRLVREDFDRLLDGVVEQTRTYSYSCTAK